MSNEREIEYIIRVKDEATKALKSMRVAAAGATAALAAIGGAAVAAANFEKAMAEVATLSPDIHKNFKQISNDVLELSGRLGQDAVDSTKALYQAISAGVPADNAISFLEVATKAAIAGVTDTETAVDGLTTVLNAFGMSTEDVTKVSDVMFKTVKAGKTNFEQLSGSLFNVAPIAAAAGVKFEEISAALAVMTASGTLTSVATTQLRAAIVGVTRPSEDLISIWQSMGYESGQAALQSIGLQGALAAIADEAHGDIGAMTKLLGSQEAVAAALNITGKNADKFSSQLYEMNNATGATEEAFRIMAETSAQQFAQLKASLNVIVIQIGSVVLPVLNSIAQAVLPVIQSFSKWAAENPKIVTIIVAMVAAIAGLILVLTSVAGIVAVVAAAFASGFLGIAAAVAVGVGAVVAGGIAIMSQWDLVAQTLQYIWDIIKTTFMNSLLFIVALMTGDFETMFQIIGGFVTSALGFFSTLWANIRDLFGISTEDVKNAFKDSLQAMLEALFPWAAVLKEQFGAVFDWIIQKIGQVIDSISNAVSAVRDYISPKSSSRTQRRASGGFGGGRTLVGETGPELVDLPEGSYVHRSGESSRMAGGSAPVINIHAGTMIGLSKRELAQLVGQEVIRYLKPNTSMI